MIAVAAKSEDHAVVAEFFELFKTPWEFLHPGSGATVLLCAQNEIPASDAKLVLIYGGELNAFDRAQSAPVRPQGVRKMLSHGGRSFPIYGPSLAFENSAVPALMETKNGSQTIVRLGYDLFSEVRHLLTVGQPTGHAAAPTLERHIELLRELIVRYAPPLLEIPPAPAGHNFIACLTHDVDHVGIRNHKFDHTMFGFVFRATIGSVLDLARGKKTFRQLLSNWLAVLKLPFVHLGLAKDFWYQFDHYVALESGTPSTFFVIPKKGETGLDAEGNRAPKRAASYDARDLKQILIGLKHRGKEIGTHGLDAWRDATAGRDEKKIISEITGAVESGVRMHWLYFGEQSHAVLEAAGFTYDSTVGYNATVGYRAGTTQVFKPLTAKKLLELPMHAMDTALFYPSYLNLSPAQAAEKIGPLVEFAARSGGAFVVNWHDRSIAPERLWDGSYTELISACKESGAWFATAGQAVEWFRQRREVTFEGHAQGTKIRTATSGGKNLPGLRVRVHTSAAKFAEQTLRDGMEISLSA
jgi:hypothetical protein